MEAQLINAEAGSRNELCPVNSHNEWDPLEEIIVGRLEGATMPSNHPVVTCNVPQGPARYLPRDGIGAKQKSKLTPPSGTIIA